VLAYLRTHKNLSRAAVKQECDYYGISLEYGCGGEQSACCTECRQEEYGNLNFFLIIEYNKMGPSYIGRLRITIPHNYRRGCSSNYLKAELQKERLSIAALLPIFYRTITIKKIRER
jgi:hypothetical protein